MLTVGIVSQNNNLNGMASINLDNQSDLGGEPTMETGDWRAQLPPDARQRIVNEIMETLRKHLQFSGQGSLQELENMTVRFEEEIYTAATSQPDYLRKVSLELLTIESCISNVMASNNVKNPSGPGEQDDYILMDTNNWRPTAPAGEPTMDTGDWRAQLPPDLRQIIVNKVMETLKKHLPFSGEEGLQELKKIAVRFEEKIYNAATSQPDYLRKLSLKMVPLETKS